MISQYKEVLKSVTLEQREKVDADKKNKNETKKK